MRFVVNIKKLLSINITTIAFLGVIIQLLSTQGILMYNLFDKIGIWKVKTILHPIGVGLVFIAFLGKIVLNGRKKISKETIILFYYLIVHYLVLFFTGEFSIISAIYSIREVVVMFLLIVAYDYFVFSNVRFKIFAKILLLLVLFNIVFVFLTYYLGPEDYMLLLTGRYFYPKDPLLNFKISTFLGVLPRSPGLIGESAAVGFFAVFSYFILSKSDLKKYSWLCVLLVFMTLTRSAIMVLFIYFLLSILIKKGMFRKVIWFSPIILVVGIISEKAKLLNIRSMEMRVDNWINRVNLDSNPLFGGNLHNIGAAAPKGIGFAATMDSYWLFLFHGIGLLGIFLVGYFVLKKMGYSRDTLLFSISVFVGGVFVTFTQSIPFLVLFPLLALREWFDKGEDSDFEVGNNAS